MVLYAVVQAAEEEEEEEEGEEQEHPGQEAGVKAAWGEPLGQRDLVHSVEQLDAHEATQQAPHPKPLLRNAQFAALVPATECHHRDEHVKDQHREPPTSHPFLDVD
jgi:hypothetical protein